MTLRTPQKQSRPRRSHPTLRWLALAGVAIGLATPFTASAHADDNGTLEVLASAAVAYAVIDAAGGFDKHRHVHRQRYDYDHRYRHNDHYRWHRYHDQYHWRGHSYKRQDWHAYPHKGWKHDRRHGDGHHRGHERRGHDGRDYRHRAYH